MARGVGLPLAELEGVSLQRGRLCEPLSDALSDALSEGPPVMEARGKQEGVGVTEGCDNVSCLCHFLSFINCWSNLTFGADEKLPSAVTEGTRQRAAAPRTAKVFMVNVIRERTGGKF